MCMLECSWSIHFMSHADVCDSVNSTYTKHSNICEEVVIIEMISGVARVNFLGDQNCGIR